ncbi:MAG TPA: hypothetical protein VFW84_04435 [Aquabacterium sp.]|uniref:hypothetical protein n=1 Tax=Aquabacterium sp. TaxID=1872578 RepID=UPI002E321BF3|nr:hypothetical protein [Aquabacterium sp.]HEX5371959.1 hypothetical protein [Aquabacterium sp.]
MQTSLNLFIRQYVGVVLAALVPVVLVAFMSMPFTMGGHPGEMRVVAEVSTMQHPS